MARARVMKRLCEAFKGTVPTGSSAHPVLIPKLPHESLPRRVNASGSGGQADRTFTHKVTKKLHSRTQRAVRFGDHGSSAAFKKVVRRRERVNASMRGLPSYPPMPYDLHSQSSERDFQDSLLSPVRSTAKEIRSFSPPSDIKDGLPAPCVEQLDEMEDVVPAPLIYHDLVSQPVRTVQSPLLVRPPTIPVSSTRTQELPSPPPTQSFPSVPPALIARSPVIQPPFIAPSRPTQPGQPLPIMSHFCRNLGRTSNEVAYPLRALHAVGTRERCALSLTTPAATTASWYASATTLVRLPPAPTKAVLAYSRPGGFYAELDE